MEASYRVRLGGNVAPVHNASTNDNALNLIMDATQRVEDTWSVSSWLLYELSPHLVEA